MNVFNDLIQFWVSTHWLIALLMSSILNVSVYVVAAFILDSGVNHLVNDRNVGTYIDERKLRPNQHFEEMRAGLIACVIFAIGSLLSRELFSQIWPDSWLVLMAQIVAFVVFYEVYSYFVHRLLHTRFFIKFHGVHHKSVRVTPWAAYSVHPLEASFIGVSAPIFMLFFPISLGVALILHILGMMFTILLHSNYQIQTTNPLISMFMKYPEYHSRHHLNGLVNLGFVNSLLDDMMKTSFSKRNEKQ